MCVRMLCSSYLDVFTQRYGLDICSDRLLLLLSPDNQCSKLMLLVMTQSGFGTDSYVGSWYSYLG